jgi:hypothetical protein
MTTKRLALAYALAPIGAVSFVAVLFSSANQTSQTILEWLSGPAVALAMITGIAYIIGAILLPVFFLLERLGWRGWQFYVPIAATAGFITGLALHSPSPIPWLSTRNMLYSIAGGLSGAVFSGVLGWRSNRPLQPASGARRRAD